MSRNLIITFKGNLLPEPGYKSLGKNCIGGVVQFHNQNKNPLTVSIQSEFTAPQNAEMHALLKILEFLESNVYQKGDVIFICFESFELLSQISELKILSERETEKILSCLEKPLSETKNQINDPFRLTEYEAIYSEHQFYKIKIKLKQILSKFQDLEFKLIEPKKNILARNLSSEASGIETTNEL